MKSFVFKKKLVLRKDGKEVMGFFNPDTLETKIYAVGNSFSVECSLKSFLPVCLKERKNGFIPFHTHPKKHNKNFILSSNDLINPYLTDGAEIIFNQKYLCQYVPVKKMSVEKAKESYRQIVFKCHKIEGAQFWKEYQRLIANTIPALKSAAISPMLPKIPSAK